MRRVPWMLALFHGLFVVFLLAPLVIVVLVAFTDKGYIALPFDGASLRWFIAIAKNQDFVDAFWRSVGLAAFSATLASALAIPAGLAVARHRFPGREAFLGLMLSPLMVPHLVLGIALLKTFTQIGWQGTIGGLVAAHAVLIFPYALRLIVAAATGFDQSVLNAAESLGASRWTRFRRIELPLLLPGIAGGWLIAFINSFDEVTMSVFVASPATETLPVKMYHYVVHTIDPLLASISTVLIVLTLALMLVLDRSVGLDRVFSGKV